MSLAAAPLPSTSNTEAVIATLRDRLGETWPLPGAGNTAERHRRLFALGREDLSLARLAEAHWDAVAILAEAGREPEAGALYGVWAAEIPGKPLRLTDSCVSGAKVFCSGAGLVDRALVTAGGPQPQLLEFDLRAQPECLTIDLSGWKTAAFASTHTGLVTFHNFAVQPSAFIGEPGWYLARPGFWHGACGPAACWAGGAAGLLDYALAQRRSDAHTLAHVGAIYAEVWGLEAALAAAGDQIDRSPQDIRAGHVRALAVRHLVERAGTDTLRRLTRAFGPHPLALDEAVGRRALELDLYLRQCHAERDLEVLGRVLRESNADSAAAH